MPELTITHPDTLSTTEYRVSWGTPEHKGRFSIVERRLIGGGLGRTHSPPGCLREDVVCLMLAAVASHVSGIAWRQPQCPPSMPASIETGIKPQPMPQPAVNQLGLFEA